MADKSIIEMLGDAQKFTKNILEAYDAMYEHSGYIDVQASYIQRGLYTS